ncbi:choice-of-anchor tandem repeat GloVer-containing protein [Pantoea sp. 18069]|uniref:choice-of-anchor tandem repeat GloVer-containing protein n=1 Tax=Pantoea sp. 18069 TaxID=2681415 RepID=UPI0013596179|nr:choice-of-anchor tandem repeat GloVer-containing protein [Pantoea sp. 18069]
MRKLPIRAMALSAMASLSVFTALGFLPAAAQTAVADVRVNHITSFHTYGAAALPRVSDPTPPLHAANGQLYGLTSSLWGRADPSVYRLPPTPAHYQVEYLDATQRSQMRQFSGRLVQNSRGELFGLSLPSNDSQGQTAGGVLRAEFDGTHLSILDATLGQLNNPVGSLVVDAQDNLYGLDAGPAGHGRIFRVDGDGRFSTVHSFDAPPLAQGDTGSSRQPVWIALGSDGALYASLLSWWQWTQPIAGGTRTMSRRASSFYRIDAPAAGGAAQALIELPESQLLIEAPLTGTDMRPGSAFVEGADGYLYGSAEQALFRMRRDGQDLRVLHRFAASESDTARLPGQGMRPLGDLVVAADGNVYGTTYLGGASKSPIDAGSDAAGHSAPTFDGTLFRIVTARIGDADGGFQYLHSFRKSVDGKMPIGLSKGRDGKLYGASQYGGQPYIDFVGREQADDNKGTVFQVDLQGNVPSASVTLTVDPPLLAPGATATLAWTSSGASACVASGGVDGWAGSRQAQGSFLVTPASGLYYFTLTCQDDLKGGQVVTDPVVLRVNAQDTVQDSNSTSYGNGGGAAPALLLVALCGLLIVRHRLRRQPGAIRPASTPSPSHPRKS